ncbi:MAG: hypothetical protein ACRD1R_02615 [Acidobacteriota bacterium]
MRKVFVLVCAVAVLAFAPAYRQSDTESALPGFYRHVDTIVWVVDDLQPVLEGWRSF